jgi:hypothetical protein
MIGSSSGAIVSAFAACGVDSDAAAAKALQLMENFKVRWMLASQLPWPAATCHVEATAADSNYRSTAPSSSETEQWCVAVGLCCDPGTSPLPRRPRMPRPLRPSAWSASLGTSSAPGSGTCCPTTQRCAAGESRAPAAGMHPWGTRSCATKSRSCCYLLRAHLPRPGSLAGVAIK